MSVIVEESCPCGAALEVEAPEYYLSYVTERLGSFEQDHRSCRGGDLTGLEKTGKPEIATRPEPPKNDAAATPMPQLPPQSAPVRRHSDKPKTYPPRTCEQCGKQFVPNHGRTKICSDECRERRAKDRLNGVKKSFSSAVLKRDAEEVQHEVKKELLAEKYAPSHVRDQPRSNLQSAPRAKLKPVQHLPAIGGYAPPGSPEAVAAIERVKQEQSVGGVGQYRLSAVLMVDGTYQLTGSASTDLGQRTHMAQPGAQKLFRRRREWQTSQAQPVMPRSAQSQSSDSGSWFQPVMTTASSPSIMLKPQRPGSFVTAFKRFAPPDVLTTRSGSGRLGVSIAA